MPALLATPVQTAESRALIRSFCGRRARVLTMHIFGATMRMRPHRLYQHRFAAELFQAALKGRSEEEVGDLIADAVEAILFRYAERKFAYWRK
jgi:hypothetical protein